MNARDDANRPSSLAPRSPDAGSFAGLARERLPDFVIVGAPKCGTTSLFTYLHDHPGTFMATRHGGRKIEPQYFCSDFPGIAQVKGAKDYQGLFNRAPAGTLRGESSAWYLFSQVAARQIIGTIPDVKLVVMLRNPVDMARSLHGQLVYSLREDVHDFEAAWELQEDRKHGRRLPRHCREPSHLQYQEVCSFAHQLERVFDHVPRRQVKVVLLEDLLVDARATYLSVLDFLGLADDGRNHFPQINGGSTYRNRAVVGALHRLPRQIDPLLYRAKHLANRTGFRPLRLLKRVNAKRQGAGMLRPTFHRHLAERFAGDVRRTEQILGRTLEPWWDRLRVA